MDAQTLVVLVVIGLVVAAVIYFSIRKPPAEKPRAQEPPEAKPTDALKPTTKALDERMEVEAPVEIHEGMSLAEIKRAKAARIKGKEKGRRKTAAEATAEARSELAEPSAPEEEAPEEEAAEPEEPVEEEPVAEAEPPVAAEEETSDVDAGWDLLDEDEDDFGFDFGKEEKEEEERAKEEEERAKEEEERAREEEERAREEEERAREEEERAREEEERQKAEAEAEAEVEEPIGLDQMSESMGTPLSEGLARTRTGFIHKLGKIFRRDELDDSLVEEVEEVLYTADIGTRAATDILRAIEEHLSRDEKQDPEAVWAFVRDYVEQLLRSREEKLDIDSAKPFVILVIGVNGVGKTTTIGKMAAKFKRAGKSVLLVAGDTFRAAAVEQIEVWGDRAGIPVHTGEEKADPSSVVFAGVERAVKEDFDVVICDTAGRLHTKAPLLDELEKMKRVASKVIDDAPHETILVLDANTGQNAIQQAKIFREAVPITGIVLTKLDGTAKGGVILGICDELDAPIRYIGIGESVADLRQFDAGEFTEALFM